MSTAKPCLSSGEMNEEIVIVGEACSLRNKSLAVWAKLDGH
ncbi:hypothetical protein ACVWWT_001762 [Pseudomonas sp. TE6349]